MNDLISRETAIEEIYFECYESTCDDEYGQGYNDGLRKSIHKLKYLPTIEPEPAQRWIPVSERLPEPGQWVIATYERTYSDTGVTRRLVVDTIYSARKGWDDTPGIRRTVAWMPMPEPYAPTQSNDSKALDTREKEAEDGRKENP